MELILASASPRRRELLGLITPDFRVETAGVEEQLPEGIPPQLAVQQLSRRKAQALRRSRREQGLAEAVILGADTVVAVDRRILGKPRDAEEAAAMLRLLSGREHSVYTGVTLLAAEREEAFVQETKVRFYPLTEEEIAAYIATGEPFDKAGGYGIQGRGSMLVWGITGDYFNVVGLPVARVARLLKKLWKNGEN